MPESECHGQPEKTAKNESARWRRERTVLVFATLRGNTGYGRLKVEQSRLKIGDRKEHLVQRQFLADHLVQGFGALINIDQLQVARCARQGMGNVLGSGTPASVSPPV